MLLVLLMVVAPLGGCKKKQLTDKEYEELAQKQAEKNKKKVVLRVTEGNETFDVTLYDALYYLVYNEKSALSVKNEQNSYFASMYGEDYNFWEITNSDGIKTKDGYKENAYATVVYTTVFYNEAKKAGMELEEIRRIQLDSATAMFMNDYTAEQRAKCGMTEACIRENYEKIFLADQYVEKMTSSYEVDEQAIRDSIDKEDYRVYETDYLFVQKSGIDENYERFEYTPEEQEMRKNAVEDALVAPAVPVHALGDVAGLLRDMNGHFHTAAADRVPLAPLAEVLVRVADLADRLADELGEFAVRVPIGGGHFAGEGRIRVLQLQFKGDPSVRIVFKVAVEDVAHRVVAKAVGMPDRAVFGCLNSHNLPFSFCLDFTPLPQRSPRRPAAPRPRVGSSPSNRSPRRT